MHSLPSLRARPIALGALLALLTACGGTSAPSPLAQPIASQDSNPLATLPAGASDQPLPERWWQLYQDPVLDQLVQQALRHNQDLARADANVQAMLAGIGELDAQRWPSTQTRFAAQYGKTANDQTLAQATDSHAPAQWTFEPGIELAYQVDIWGQVRRAIERARVQAGAASDARELLRINVAAQTSRAYLDHCTYGAQLGVTNHSLQTVEHSLELTETQRRAGIATELDTLRLRSLRDRLRAELPLLDARRRVAVYELNMLTGQASGSDPQCAVIPRLTVALPVGDGWHLLERRPDIRQARRNLEAAVLASDIARADLYPKVSFGASLTSSAQSLHELGDSRSVMFGIGPLISWEFPNIKANRMRIDKARALEQAQLAGFRSAVLAALADVRQTLALFDGQRQRAAALQATLQDSERSYALAQTHYRAGTVDALQLLDSERELMNVRSREVQARGELARSEINLFRALGGGWQPLAVGHANTQSTSPEAGVEP
ncbi:efflux transporter outer membrane subunit [Pseudomonas sp. COR18]|uniref:efflux transporter outer membrane subunit n=1 Tax=Pseudomonas sp. COR18 TaxID=3399680 RepID=UPI003AFF6723